MKEHSGVDRTIYILGAGGMARETLSIYRDLGKFGEVAGFIEENCKRQKSKIHDKGVMDASIIDTLPRNSTFIGAMGSPRKKRWIEQIELKGFNFDTATHPSVVIGDFVNIDKGCIICSGVILTCDIKIGRHSIVNISAAINHDSIVGNFVTIGPGTNIAGNVTIGDESLIGIGVTIIDRISIGKGSFIGAGAIVTENIPENVLAVGAPAKPLRKLSESDWRELI